MTTFLAAAATALGHLLGLARSVAAPPSAPPAAPLTAAVLPLLPLLSLGLPGNWTPQTGSEP